MSWLAWQKVMVVSGNAGRNFSPLRPPCPVTITLTHHPNCFALCFFCRFAARLAYCCPASLCFLIHPLPSLIALLMLLLIAFAPRSSISLLPFAPCFAPPIRSSLRPSLLLLASSLTFTPLLIIIFTNKQILHRGKLHQGLCEDDDRREVNILYTWRGAGPSPKAQKRLRLERPELNTRP